MTRKQDVTSEREGAVLVADIGGTNARFAILTLGELSPVRSLRVADYSGVADAIALFLRTAALTDGLTGAIFGVAGPVNDNRCALTNSSWVVDGKELQDLLKLRQVHVINDFEAIAWSLPQLAANDLFAVADGHAVSGAPCAVLGPGTGLGLAYLLEGAGGVQVVSTEGGHATLPATSSREVAVIEHLRARFGHVSAERALSGAGLENLFSALKAIDGADLSDRSAAEITQAALDGSCPTSMAALDMFCEMLGTVAGNIALTLGARGGIYLAGGILPRMLDYLARSQFRAKFESKGRFRPYLRQIPTNVIVHPDPAFIGLKALVVRQFVRPEVA